MTDSSVLISIIGYIAGLFTSAGSFPQVIKCLATKQVHDISPWMPFLISTGSFLWLIYGYSIQSMPLILTNLVAFIANMTLLGLCLWYRKA